MHYEKPGLALFAGVIALSSSCALSLSAAAQGGLLDRIQERREAREQSRDQSQGTQQNQPQYSQQGQPQYQQQSQPQGQMQQGQMPAGRPEISMVTLQTQMGPSGQQMVVTPKGYVVPLPGVGVNGQAVQVYMASTGGYWYVDKNNQQVDLTPAVQQMQATMAQAQSQPPVQPPQYAPVPQEYSNSGSNSNSGSGGAAMTAAVAGGLGAMAGAAISNSTNSWNTIPYGTAVRYGAAASPYYNQGGKPVYINNSNTVNAYHANNIEQQQNWYKQQQVAQGATWKAWQQPTTNPFVNSGSGTGMAAYGVEQGQQAEKNGAAVGAAADRYGHNQGQQDARYGAAAGATADRYGQQQGQDAARYGAAAGARADNQGHEQGQQDARFGAAAGAHADNQGREQGQQSARFGAAAGARGDGGDRRSGGARGRFR